MTSARNVSASVRQRLLNRSRSDRRPFNELLQYFAMERFLYRLSQSTHAYRFVLKGALMLRVWGSPEFRPTMDIDLLGRTLNEEADFYDIWLLSRLFDFEGPKLAQAILGTFVRRGTALPSEIEVFTEPFIDARQSQWTAFRNRLQQDHVPAFFGEITASVGGFLLPVVAAVSSGKSSPKDWIAPGPWT